MDSKVEDKIVRQIEKNLSNNINESLFLTGRVYEKDNNKAIGISTFNSPEIISNSAELQQDNPAVSFEYINQSPTTLSRAEYIRQAREACLRQISSIQSSARAYEVNYPEEDLQSSEQLNRKKSKALRLFQEGSIAEDVLPKEDTPQEIASFRYLIIRTICAIVLFLSIFIFDKFDFKIGNFTPKVIQEYVTGNDSLQDLEDLLVTWLD
ncbi:MAG: hypothetical protein ACYDEX_09190 [Mobilitalea sp.]